MKNLIKISIVFVAALFCFSQCSNIPKSARITKNFGEGWKFTPGDINDAQNVTFNDSGWRQLNLPHDWSIEGKFNKDNPATPGGGALPGGIGWYRKAFSLSESNKDKLVFIDFDGIYCNSEVWINGHYLGLRPYGYISFRYELTPYLNYGEKTNVIAVKVDNSKQPNSRWYSGSGIYRNVWLVITNKTHIDHWGTYITTPEVTAQAAKVRIKTTIKNQQENEQPVTLQTMVYDATGKKVATSSTEVNISKGSVTEVEQEMKVTDPVLWSDESPYLYKAVSYVKRDGKICDNYETTFGIRYFTFDKDKGFFLNDKYVKIKGVCNHHDLGCLGSAVNTRAIERQLQILKKMGCNGIRTSHNPPAPELLDLCDKMGFIVMDEAFDMWENQKTKYDYHLFFDQWYKRDLEDMVLRDRNHPSVIMWSIGNEIREQWDPKGDSLAKQLSGIIKKLDTTRLVTSACNRPGPENFIIQSGALDIIGQNYGIQYWMKFPEVFPGKKFIASETTSAIATRGHYDMPSDTIRRWPSRELIAKIMKLMKENDEVDFAELFAQNKGLMNADFTCSAYDNCSVPWGSTHEETWKIVKKYDFISGMFIWTGFDYLGEPTPYPWPARSSYFGIIDLTGFPKDAYYMYQSEWTNTDVLHIFPHWNWEKGDTVDVWAYTNCGEAELFLNDKSLGTKTKQGDELHLIWRIPFVPGTLKAIGRTDGKEIMTTEVKTAGPPAKIILEADRSRIHADGKDLSFVTVTIVDKDGTMVPDADNLVRFKIDGNVTIAGVDNGSQISHEPFKADYRKTFNGKCLVVLQPSKKSGQATITTTSEGLDGATVTIEMK